MSYELSFMQFASFIPHLQQSCSLLVHSVQFQFSAFLFVPFIPLLPLFVFVKILQQSHFYVKTSMSKSDHFLFYIGTNLKV